MYSPQPSMNAVVPACRRNAGQPGQLLGDRDLEVMARHRLVERERLGLVAGARLRRARVEVVAARPAAVLGRLEVVGDRRVGRLVGAHLHDHAAGPGQDPEPIGQCRDRPVERGLAGREHLRARREAKRRVGAQALDGGAALAQPDRPPGRLGELAVDPLHLGQPDRVDLVRRSGRATSGRESIARSPPRRPAARRCRDGRPGGRGAGRGRRARTDSGRRPAGPTPRPPSAVRPRTAGERPPTSPGARRRRARGAASRRSAGRAGCRARRPPPGSEPPATRSRRRAPSARWPCAGRRTVPSPASERSSDRRRPARRPPGTRRGSGGRPGDPRAGRSSSG